jgi:formamidopyrimidine-DNA glycosylase
VIDQPLEPIRIVSPFLVRSVEPAIESVEGAYVRELRRIGKRIIFRIGDDRFLVFHLMIAGRFRWQAKGAKPPAKIGLAAFDFPTGTLALTESGSRKRASLYVVAGEAELKEHDRGGVEILDADMDEQTFTQRLIAENHTLKRALTDPRLFSGIGNAYSDEILHAARLSPLKLTTRLSDKEIHRLYEAAQSTLRFWIDELCGRFDKRFPGPRDITAFRKEFAVHGRYDQPCPICATPVQRIRYADNETNYCPTCQNEGRMLADRSLSRLLKNDWPRHVEELEEK